jgi:thioredoxin-related protein
MAAFVISSAEEKSEPDSANVITEVDTTEISWLRYDEGLELAEKNGKYILAYFTADWCRYCRIMEKETFQTAEAIKLINNNYVPVIIDGESKVELDIDGYKITERNLAKSEYRISGYPTFWFLKPNAERLAPVRGYKSRDMFLNILSYVKDDLYDKMSFDDYLKNGGRNGE